MSSEGKSRRHLMKNAMAVITGSVLLSSLAMGQEAPPNAPKFVKSVKAPGLDVRYLDFRWDEEAFAALEKGGSHPAAQRSWVIARLMLQLEPLKWNGKTIPVGSSLLVLNPAKGSAGPTLEVRYVDMREVFVDMNVIAEPPPGEVYQQAPAVFKKVDALAPRLDVSLREKGGSYDLAVHYGNRQAAITLTR
jgi:hypothetical protein